MKKNKPFYAVFIEFVGVQNFEPLPSSPKYNLHLLNEEVFDFDGGGFI
jgi:hypothetical protein